MKHLSVLVLGLLLLLAARPAAAQAGDTLTGQTRFLRLLSASLCTHIEAEEKKQRFETFTAKQADDLFMRLMVTSMSEHAPEFTALLKVGEQHGLSSRALGESLGVTAIKSLSEQCPRSMALVMRTSSAQREMGAKNQQSFNNVSAEEKAVLQPLADSICTKLAAEDARQPLRARPLAARSELMTTLMQTMVVKNMPALMTIYSMEQLSNQESMRAMGLKLAGEMLVKCPSYLIMLGEDAKKQKGGR